MNFTSYLLAVGCALYASGGNISAAPRPNIVMVVIDDMGWGDLSCFGNTEAQTPHIDRIAAEGIRFGQFCVNSPICSPSRCALTTGQYPQRWGITSFLSNRADNDRRGVAQWLDPKAPTLPRFGVNRTEFVDSVWHGEKNRNPNGSVSTQGGFIASVQHRNKLLAFTSPYPKLQYSGDRKLPGDITSVQTSVALLDLQAKPSWEIYLDGKRIET